MPGYRLLHLLTGQAILTRIQTGVVCYRHGKRCRTLPVRGKGWVHLPTSSVQQRSSSARRADAGRV